MGRPNPFRLEAAGWGFWLVTTFVLSIPCIYLAFQFVEKDLSAEIPIGFGLLASSVGAAFVTLGVNTVIQKAHGQRKAAERKLSKSKKKR